MGERINELLRKPRKGEMKMNLSIFRYRPVRWGTLAVALLGASELNLLPGCPEIERKAEPEVPTCEQTAQSGDGLERMAERCLNIPAGLLDDVVQNELKQRGCEERVSLEEPVRFDIEEFPQEEWCVVIDRAA